MGHRKNYKPRSTPLKVRVFLVVFGVCLIAFASLTLREGRLHYSNYWGGSVFAPFAIFGGALMIFAAFKAE